MKELLMIGSLTGFTLAAPIGTSNMLCIQKSLAFNWKAGFIVGLGSACADWLFALLILFGFLQIQNQINLHNNLWTLIGGLFLIGLGVLALYKPVPALQTRKKRLRDHAKGFMTGFIATASNPLTMIGIASALATAMQLGITKSFTWYEGFLFMFGMIIGSLTWWIGLSKGVSFFSKSFSAPILHRINIVMSCLIIVCGCVLIGYFFR